MDKLQKDDLDDILRILPMPRHMAAHREYAPRMASNERSESHIVTVDEKASQQLIVVSMLLR